MNKLIILLCLVFLPQLGLIQSNSALIARQTHDEFVVYKCRFVSVTDYERLLEDLLSDDEQRQVFIDRDKNRLCLRGSTVSHKLAKDLLEKVLKLLGEKEG